MFINLTNDTEKLVYILNLKKSFPNLDYVVTLDNGDLKNTFISAGVTNTISKHEISSKLLASYMFEPDVAAYSESILSFADTVRLINTIDDLSMFDFLSISILLKSAYRT